MKALDFMNKFNNGSLTKVIYYMSPKDLHASNLERFNLVFTKNGLYYVQKTNFGQTYENISEIKYSNTNLLDFDHDRIIMCNAPKLPLVKFEEIVEAFKYVSEKSKYELMYNVYWDTQNNQFILDLLDQDISGGLVKYIYTDEYEMDERYIRYLQIHSHNTMTANFSSTDNNDETGKNLCYFGVLGKFNSNSTCYNVDSKYRIYSGIRFLEMDAHAIIDLPIPTYKMPETDIEFLDDMIKRNQIKVAPVGMTGHLGREVDFMYALNNYRGSGTEFIEPDNIVTFEK